MPDRITQSQGNGFESYVRQQSIDACDARLGLPRTPEQQACYLAMADESLAAQKAIKAADTLPSRCGASGTCRWDSGVDTLRGCGASLNGRRRSPGEASSTVALAKGSSSFEQQVQKAGRSMLLL